jgi:hypothetical protein
MSKRNKQRTTPMSNDQQATEQTQVNEADQSGQVDQSTQQDTQPETTAVAEVSQQQVTEEPSSNTELVTEVEEPKVEVPVVKTGSVVSGKKEPLGSKLPEKEVAKVLAQPSKAVPATPSVFQKKIDTYIKEGGIFEQHIVDTLNRYINEMAPGKQITEDKARTLQNTLWKTITSIVNTEENFTKNFKTLIMFFREHRDGALGDRYTFRFSENNTVMSKDQLASFQKMLALLSVAAGLNNQKEVHKFIKLDAVLDKAFNDEARQRVIGYFS